MRKKKELSGDKTIVIRASMESVELEEGVRFKAEDEELTRLEHEPFLELVCSNT